MKRIHQIVLCHDYGHHKTIPYVVFENFKLRFKSNFIYIDIKLLCIYLDVSFDITGKCFMVAYDIRIVIFISFILRYARLANVFNFLFIKFFRYKILIYATVRISRI